MAEASNRAIPFEKHPLYEEAMQQIVAGDKEAAVATLTRLREQYPDEQFLQDLLVRVQLQSTFGGGEYIPVDHSQGTPILRTVVLVMLAITTCLVVAAALIAIKTNYLDGHFQSEAVAAEIDTLWDDLERYKAAGDLVRVRQILEELDRLTPDNPEVQKALAEVDRLQWCSDTYADAVALDRRGDWQAAGDTAVQIPQDCPNWDDVQRFLEGLKKQGAIKSAWAEAQDLFDAGDCSGAVATLTWIREEDQDFLRTQVEDLLYQCHKRDGLQLLGSAQGDVLLVKEAGDQFKAALMFQPADQELLTEYGLAVDYVAGHEAYDRGDWSVAVVRWEPLYAERPNYQNGVLRQKLFDSYPRAATQLISEANGSARLLKQAIDHIDRASDPGNESLLQERTFAQEYLAGLEAFSQEDWDLAIANWGPIYTARPEYQNGVLADNLRLACTQSSAPDEQYCKP
jgi:hypothetical protein